MTGVDPTATAVIVQILAVLLGLYVGAIYSAAEVAFFKLYSLPNFQEYASGDAQDRWIHRLLHRPNRLLATILIGNTVSNVVVSIVAASLTVQLISVFALPKLVIFVVEFLVISFSILILSEIAPKWIALENPRKVARSYAGFIYIQYWLFHPFTRLMADSAIALEKVVPKSTSKVTSDDLRLMAQAGHEDGSLKQDEREIIENVIEFGTISAKEIMTSRVDIEAISVDASLEEVLDLIRRKGYSRLPLYENDLDTIHGILYSKDVLPFLHVNPEETTIQWKTLARKALFIPPTKKLDELLTDFQSEKTHMAIVVDEYGGTEGLITMDDLLEEIVGDMADESDEEEEKSYRPHRQGGFVCDARMDLDEVEDLFGLEITSADDEFESLGGLIYHLTERIPNVGEKVTYKGLVCTVQSLSKKRIAKVWVRAMG